MLKVLSCFLTAAVFSAHLRAAITINETFETDPVPRGWRLHGDASFFQWNATTQNLDVTWDSRQTNSYFYLPLGTILAKSDDFALSFDLRLRDIMIGIDPAKPFTFQVAVGFLNFSNATRTNFFRGTGTNSPNVVEFDYFPDSGFGPSVSPAVISSNNQFGGFAYAVYEVTTDQLFEVDMQYSAARQALVTTVSSNGVSIAVTNQLDAGFTDFRVDMISISSFSDAGQDPRFSGSILAHGVIDNISLTVPEPPVGTVAGSFVNNTWQVRLNSKTGWTYFLERSSDFQSWAQVGASVPGNDGVLILTDAQPSIAHGFYRIRAERP